MVKKYPDFERGESASETGRTHIPPRLFKEAVRLNRQKDKIARLLSEITPLNAKKKSAEIESILTDYIPSVEKLMTRMKKASSAVKELKKEIAALEQEVNSSKASVQRQLELTRKVQELDDLRQTVEELGALSVRSHPKSLRNITIQNLKERKPLPLSNISAVPNVLRSSACKNCSFDNTAPVMYTVDDIQRIFSIGRTKVYQLMCSSGFPAIRLNKKLLVSKEKLEEWIRKNSGKTYNY